MTYKQREVVEELKKEVFVKDWIETQLDPKRVILWTEDGVEAHIHEDGRTYWSAQPLEREETILA